MRRTLYRLSLVLSVFPALQGCACHQSLTVEQLKGPAIKVQAKKLAQNPAQACAEVKSFRIPAMAYMAAARQAGILPDDFSSLHRMVAGLKITISVRDANESCAPHLRAGLASKGHDVLTKTFTAASLPPKYQYLAGTVSTLTEKPGAGEQLKDPVDKLYLTKDGNPLTCDYDLMDIAQANGERIKGESDEDFQLRDKLNESLPWRGQPPQPVKRIMHGAQAEYSNYLRATVAHQIEEKPLIDLNRPEVPLTVFAYNGEVYRLQHIEDALNFYRCHNIAIPAEWNIQY